MNNKLLVSIIQQVMHHRLPNQSEIAQMTKTEKEELIQQQNQIINLYKKQMDMKLSFLILHVQELMQQVDNLSVQDVKGINNNISKTESFHTPSRTTHKQTEKTIEDRINEIQAELKKLERLSRQHTLEQHRCKTKK